MTLFPQAPGPIGVFDSGYGGLSVFDKIHQLMPEYDYLYLGDNARTPYGPRSFEAIPPRPRLCALFSSGTCRNGTPRGVS